MRSRLFESGGGQVATQWDSIATVVHQRLQVTVITYDRAGFGQSSFDTADYTILREIKSLETALQQIGYSNKNLLLVGHSLGGVALPFRTAAADRKIRHLGDTKFIII